MQKIIVVVGIVICLSTAAMSQSRSRTTRRQATPKPTTSSADAAAAVRNEGATKIATQIKNLSAFLYLVGGVAKGIEAIDAANKDGQPSPTNERNKAQLRASFTDFRVAMDSLEVYFRSTPELQPYYTKLVGSASGAAAAEQQAASGQFTQAGKSLLGVVGRLADVLVVMH